MDYVSGFMYSPDHQKVVLIKKKQPKWQSGLLNGVGGKVEEGETAQNAMSREFEEETGLETDPAEWRLFSIITDKSRNDIHFFYTTNEDFHKVKTVEAEEVGIYETTHLPHNIIHNLRWLIPMSLDPKLTFTSPIRAEES